MAARAADWDKTQVFHGLGVLEPLKLEEYRRVPNWDGLPLFWRNRKIVRPFAGNSMKVLFPYAAISGKNSLVFSIHEDCSACKEKHVVEIVCRPIFDRYIGDLVEEKDSE